MDPDSSVNGPLPEQPAESPRLVRCGGDERYLEVPIGNQAAETGLAFMARDIALEVGSDAIPASPTLAHCSRSVVRGAAKASMARSIWAASVRARRLDQTPRGASPLSATTRV